MNVNNVFLDKVAVSTSQYPEGELPEVSFVGKSNVGKSSLINVMINRKALARTSQNPGKTRTINFYNVEETLYFVDLPGYGYAKISRKESEKWGKMIEDYLINRKQLKGIIMLVDIRHAPSKSDKMMFDWFVHYNYKMLVVATKLDKIKKSQLQKNVSIICKTLDMKKDNIIVPFSSETKEGKDKLWEEISNLSLI